MSHAPPTPTHAACRPDGFTLTRVIAVAYNLGTPTCWNSTLINCTLPHRESPQCQYGCVQNASGEIAAMASFPNLRLYQNLGIRHPKHPWMEKPQAESPNSGWQLPKEMGGKFSAMCYFFGRDLYTSLSAAGKMRPIGLMETDVGGTPDQDWSSADAIAKCPQKMNTDSVYWNIKVLPLTRNTVKGVVWMQGEASTKQGDGRNYRCSFRALISDWRSKWFNGTDGSTELDFPFGW